MIGEGVLFIVDGKEADAFKSICPKAHFRKHTNGRNAIHQLGKECADLINKAGNYSHYIITADLERRGPKDEINFIDMAGSLHTIVCELLSWNEDYKNRLIVGVSDRMIENWLYAGIVGENIDGKHGTTHMESLGSYSKSFTATRVLHNGEFKVSNALSSPSFAHFYEQIGRLGCNYLMYNQG